MTDTTPQSPSRDTIAGGAHYHAVQTTAKWKAYVAGVQGTVTHTIAERERRTREAHGRAVRHEATEQPTTGG